MKISIYTIAYVLILSSLGSCFEDSECLNLRNNEIGISFKKKSETTDALTITNIMIPNSKYVFTPQQSSINKITLPLNPSKNTQKIEFTLSKSSQSVYRMIEISYDVKTQFKSTDCEPQFLFSNLSVIKQNFLSTKVVNPTPQQKKNKNALNTNIEVIYQ